MATTPAMPRVMQIDRGRFADVRRWRLPHRRAGRWGLLACSALAAMPWACAQDDATPAEAGAGPLSTSVALGGTWTDNVRLDSDGERADLAARAEASVNWQRAVGRLTGFLDYTLTGLTYVRNSAGSRLQNALGSAVTAELVEDRLFVDVAGAITQQTTSAFGTQTIDPASDDVNLSEVRALRISPRLRGRTVGALEYEAALAHQVTRSDDDSQSSDTSLASVRLGSDPLARLAWSTEARRQVTDFREGRRSVDDRLLAVVSHPVSRTVRLAGMAGREYQDLSQSAREGSTLYGLRMDWRPSVRTSASAEAQHRFFGTSHAASVAYRTARTAWSFTDTRDLVSAVAQPTLGGRGLAYDLFFQQLASVQPDPVQRQRMVQGFLADRGLAADHSVLGGIQTHAVALERRQRLAVAWRGPRDTLVLSANRTKANRVDDVSQAEDDLSGGNQVRQRSFAIDLAHRLTRLASVNLSLLERRNKGEFEDESNRLRVLGVGWSMRTAPRRVASLGFARAHFTSPDSPYRQDAVTAVLTVEF